jgi:hypothetical protein
MMRVMNSLIRRSLPKRHTNQVKNYKTAHIIHGENISQPSNIRKRKYVKQKSIIKQVGAANIKQRVNIVKTLRVNCGSSFYKNNDLYKFNNRNVIYISNVGNYKKEEIFKYGISGKIFEREYNAHRKNFDHFDMKIIKITDNKDIIEDLFEKELKIRDLHRTIVINGKKQTELFTINENYSFEYLEKLLNRLIEDNPSFESIQYKKKIASLEEEIKTLKKPLSP